MVNQVIYVVEILSAFRSGSSKLDDCATNTFKAPWTAIAYDPTRNGRQEVGSCAPW